MDFKRYFKLKKGGRGHRINESISLVEDTEGQKSRSFMTDETTFAGLVELKNLKSYSFYYMHIHISLENVMVYYSIIS